MDKVRKKKIKRIVFAGVALLLVVALAVMPLLAKDKHEQTDPKASILSGTAELGSISTAIHGSGNLVAQDALAVTVPEAVKLTGLRVKNGDTVLAGDALASVDRVSVMYAITQVQQTLEYLSEKIEDAGDAATQQTITALAGGTVKQLYAQVGDSVQSVMLEHGALAVLSLDGLMAVDLQTESDLSAGTEVILQFPEGDTATGQVSTNLAGEMTVTVQDKNYPVGQAVTVIDGDGNTVGQGQLYILNPWNATAYTGTVKSLKVSEGYTIGAGDGLMILTDVGSSASYLQLVSQRQAYEDLMLQLFEMYQTQTLVAPGDGVVSGVDEQSAQLLASSGSYGLQLLANAPNGDDETMYMNYLGKVAAVANNGWLLCVNPQPVPVGDYRELTGITVDTDLMTHGVLFTQTDLPIYGLVEDAWVQLQSEDIQAGDILLYAADSEGKLVWSVVLEKTQNAPGGSGDSEQPGGNTQPGDSTTPGGSETPSFSGGMSGNMGGGFPQGSVPQEEEFSVYSMSMVQVAAVIPQGCVTMEITVDEQDITALTVGMSAQVRLDALGGEKHIATVTHIGNSGTNNGGSSKYTVELTMERGENMLSGMSAAATIELSSTENIVIVPVEALVEQGTKTVIYTGYDGKKLTDPVAVTTGISDGDSVQILEGLEQGETYYYAYYDTLVVSSTPDSDGMGYLGGSFGGGFDGMGFGR